jgi:Ca-activated chloride channel family protein
MKTLYLLLLGAILLPASLAPAMAAADARPGGLPPGIDPGTLEVVQIDGEAPDEPLRLPLQHTEVSIRVAGFVARATVTQHYTNPFERPIEAVYTFPLPHDAAVDAMTMHVGDAVIRGVIQRRDEARATYERAVQAGKRAGLIEQERPNLFTQSVGNIMPGDAIRIEISYVDILDYRDEGAFELVFPMVVGPRYIPGTTVAGKAGTGWAPDTDAVPDASRITPPVLRPGERSGHYISLHVELDAAVEIHGVHSVSHAVDIETLSPSRRDIRLHPSDRIPNKDFILRYAVAGKAPEMALIPHHRAETGGYFTLIVLPQQTVTDAQAVPRDLIFVLDTSGSMHGEPMAKSREAMGRLIAWMRAADRFNIVRFAGDTGTLWSEPRPATAANRREAERFVEALRGAGGTEMRKGIVEALAQPADAGRMRIAILLTDGYVGDEAQILAAIEQERRGARVFTLGVGSSVNRYLLDRAATVGRGEAFYVRQDEDATAIIERFFHRIDRPALAHVEIDWGNLAVSDVTPQRIPDLWQGQPIEVHGRYARGGTGRITLRGQLGAEPYEQHLGVRLPEAHAENAVMATVWARARVKDLMLALAGGQDEGTAEAITALGLEYRIMTQWTAFVAVQETIVNVGGKTRTVVQPVELPEGVDYEGVFGPSGEAEVALGRQALQAGAAGAMFAEPSLAADLGLAAPKGLAETVVLPPAPPPPTKAEASAPDPASAQRGRWSDQAKAIPCRYDALSVSGGLRYPAVAEQLTLAMASVCEALRDALGRVPDTAVRVTLELGTDGTVRSVVLAAEDAVTARLAKALRKALQAWRFGPVAGAEGATVSFRLLLGQEAGTR